MHLATTSLYVFFAYILLQNLQNNNYKKLRKPYNALFITLKSFGLANTYPQQIFPQKRIF